MTIHDTMPITQMPAKSYLHNTYIRPTFKFTSLSLDNINIKGTYKALTCSMATIKFLTSQNSQHRAYGGKNTSILLLHLATFKQY